MKEPAQSLASGDDSGWSGMSESGVGTSLEGMCLESDSDAFSTDVSGRARERAQGSALCAGVGYGLQYGGE